MEQLHKSACSVARHRLQAPHSRRLLPEAASISLPSPPFALEHQRTQFSNHNACDQRRRGWNTCLDALPSARANPACNFWAVSQAEPARNTATRRRFPRSAKPTANNPRRKPHRSPGPWRNRRPFPAKPSRTRRGATAGKAAGSQRSTYCLSSAACLGDEAPIPASNPPLQIS